MLNNFSVTFQKAQEVNKLLQPLRENGFAKLEDIIDAVKSVSGYDSIKLAFANFDFNENVKDAGAMLRINTSPNTKEAFIVVNELNDAKAQKFSVVHELGHLLTSAIDCRYITPNDGRFTVSPHINTDITHLTNAQCKESNILMAEQAANVFALLVLIPKNLTIRELRENANGLASKYGVTIDALYSRLILSAVNL